jgi:hypothetical protein
MPLGPDAGYLVKYNNYTIPGYAQSETLPSEMNIASHYATYADGSNSEYTGLQNKVISIRMKVWEQDYLTCKTQIELAGTMLRSKRDGYANLYVQYTDRHYTALTQSVKTEKEVGSSVRTAEYEVSFEAKPWLESDTTHTISGTGTIDTDSLSRTIADGGWAPTTITVTGTNVTISGYTINGDFTGFISISGAVTNMIVDSDAFTATVGGVNKNNLMKWADYRTYVGPDKTFFVVAGASSCSISYHDRWYI